MHIRVGGSDAGAPRSVQEPSSVTPDEAPSFSEFRSLFDVLDRTVWLNTAAVAPAARPIVEALAGAQRSWLAGDFDWRSWEEAGERCRGLLARLINAAPESVSLQSSLSQAASIVASNCRPGRVVVPAQEFRSNLLPWTSLEHRGYEICLVGDADGVATADEIIRSIDGSTTIVALSNVQSMTGFRASLAPIVRRCREVGARIFINLTQSLGALQFDVARHQVDFVAVHGYKWLLCPRGAAWLYVRPDHLAGMTTPTPNWKCSDDPLENLYGLHPPPSTTARKLDGSLSWFSWVGAEEALKLLLRMGPGRIEERALGLAEVFRDAAASAGFKPVHREAPTHIVGLTLDDPERVRRQLRERNVAASVRGRYLRLGFHAFNDWTDVEWVLGALKT